MLTVSTASPYKFAKDVLRALDPRSTADGTQALLALSEVTATVVPAPLSNLDKKAIRFSTIIGKDEMENAVLEFSAN